MSFDLSNNLNCCVCCSPHAVHRTSDGRPVCHTCLVYRLGQPDPMLPPDPPTKLAPPRALERTQPGMLGTGNLFDQTPQRQDHRDWVEHELLCDLEDAVRMLINGSMPAPGSVLRYYVNSTDIRAIEDIIDKLNQHQKNIDQLLEDLGP